MNNAVYMQELNCKYQAGDDKASLVLTKLLLFDVQVITKIATSDVFRYQVALMLVLECIAHRSKKRMHQFTHQFLFVNNCVNSAHSVNLDFFHLFDHHLFSVRKTFDLPDRPVFPFSDDFLEQEVRLGDLCSFDYAVVDNLIGLSEHGQQRIRVHGVGKQR
jgi:hypothetical protein